MPAPFVTFFVCWIALSIAVLIFYNKANYATKKAVHPFVAIGIGLLFLAFWEWVLRGHLPWIFIVLVAVVMLLNLRNTQFCQQCNATLRGRFSRVSFCPKCGAHMES